MCAMILDLEAYFKGFTPRGSRLLTRLESEAETESIPIVGPVVGQLLHLLVGLKAAGAVLELGTATGYSTLWMAQAAVETGGRIVTLEIDPQMAARARANFKEAGCDHIIHMEVGDALENLANRSDRFDVIFMDIDKGDYLKALPHCFRLLRKKGLLIADNTGFVDADPFNRAIFEDPNWRVVNLLCLLPGHSPEKDGICLAVRD